VRLHPSISRRILLAAISVCCISIDCNHHAHFMAVQVHGVRADHMLTSELQFVELAGANSLPQFHFRQ